MKRASLAVVCVVLAVGCGEHAVQKLNGTGSTFVAPVMSIWTEEYAKAKGVTVVYESVGSSVGVERLTTGLFDFACTDAPLTEKQLGKVGSVVHVPLVLGAVVGAYNLEEVKDPLILTGPVLADIYLGKIKKWNEKPIQDLNSGVTLPDRAILAVHRSEGSGTTYIWTDYLSKVSPEFKEKVGAGTRVQWSGGLSGSGNEGVAEQVKKTPGSIGYVQLNYAVEKKLPFAVVKNREGSPVKASAESVTAAAHASLKEIPDDMRFSITNAPGEKAYPISGAVWALVPGKQSGGRGKATQEFLRWMTHEGQEKVEALHYARLPKELVERVEKKLDQGAGGK